MTEADGVKAQALDVAQNAREANIALVKARIAIEKMQNGILLLDLTTDSRHVRSAARFGPSVGREISADLETLMMIEKEMFEWIKWL